ncbi:hypothetical protein TsFJ059_007879 [Trichoderma semiorbis]|uniref:Uncharacterized protein n=1 Tax=Trichoderma semiorbis TaxID=1491008 RepID=A0A9P8HFT2_9HYPO|nr:hypothetical protein TsFJ059_007879 [Trichoderma semiorbis]
MNAPIPTAFSYRTINSIKMMLLRLLVAIFFNLPTVLSFPHILTHPHHHNTSVEIDPPLPTTIHPIPLPIPPTTSFPTPTTTSDPWKDMCKPGAECDCTRIPDKNGDEYFQCVTNPRCDHCWINVTTIHPTPPIPPATNLFSTDYRTLLPGTYTSSEDGTAHVVVVQPSSQRVTTRFVTLTRTSYVTLSVTPSCDCFFTR